MQVEEIVVTTAGITLSGTYTKPDAEGPHPAALLLAGSGPVDRDGNAGRIRPNLSRELALTLAERGWATLRYDKRGVGASTGHYLSTGFYDELSDAEAILEWLATREDVATIVLIGHSLGATFAAELAARHDTPTGVVLLAATAQTGQDTLTWQAAQIAANLPVVARGMLRLLHTDVRRQQRKALDRIATTESDVARIQGTRINARWMREFIAYDPTPALSGINVPVLAMTGSKDTQVDPEDLDGIAALLPSAQVHVLADVDHILRHEPRPVSEVRRYKKQAAEPMDPAVARLLLEWLSRLPDDTRSSMREQPVRPQVPR